MILLILFQVLKKNLSADALKITIVDKKQQVTASGGQRAFTRTKAKDYKARHEGRPRQPC